MSKIYQPHATCSPSSQNDAYLYTIVPILDHGLAAITSANELIFLDRQRLPTTPVLRLTDTPPNLSCLVRGDDAGSLVLCSGGDGSVATFDVRSQRKNPSLTSVLDLDRAITALASKDNHIALGTEFARHQAVVSIWDKRQNRQIWHNAENNDDITALDFHATKSNLLLAGGDDGQVSIFDTSIADEDESLFQGINYGPVHKSGFLGDDRLFVLSSDQNLSIYPISKPDDSEDPPPTAFGDLRNVVSCEYVIDVFRSGDGYAVATGANNNNPRIDIFELRHATNTTKEPKLKVNSRYTLEGGHGEEIVRSIFADVETGTIFTAGEDGMVRAFQPAASSAPSIHTKTPMKHKIGAEGRYRPY